MTSEMSEKGRAVADPGEVVVEEDSWQPQLLRG